MDVAAFVAALQDCGTDDGRGNVFLHTELLTLEQRLQQREQELASALARIAGLEAALQARQAAIWAHSELKGRPRRNAQVTEGASDPLASPKDAPRLRHRRGVRRIPLNLLQKWLGHARTINTARYATAVSAEEGHRAQDVGWFRVAPLEAHPIRPYS